MSDQQPRKHYVGSHGRRLTYEQALELGRRLFDAIEADRLLGAVEDSEESTERDDRDDQH